MQIHRVVQGDSLWSIARAYGVQPTEVALLNGLPSQSSLVPGLHLLLPRSRPVLASAATNRKPIEVNGYLIPSGTADAGLIQQVAPNLTYLSVFSYQATATGQLTPQPDTSALMAARNYAVKPLVTVTNFDGTNFNPALAHTVMSDSTIRSRLMNNIVQTAIAKGFRGVNVDFEHMNPADRPLYDNFIRMLGAAVRQRGLSMSIAMGPKTSDAPQQAWMGAFNYRALGQAVDFLMLMTYEWGWVGGPPMTHI